MPTAHNAQGWGAALWVWLRGNGYAPFLRIGIAQGNAYPSNCVKGEAQHGPNGEGWQQGKLTFCHGAEPMEYKRTLQISSVSRFIFIIMTSGIVPQIKKTAAKNAIKVRRQMHKNNLGLFYESRIVQLTVVVKGCKTTFPRIFFHGISLQILPWVV